MRPSRDHNSAPPRWLIPALVLTVVLTQATQSWSLAVRAEADMDTVRVGERVVVTVTASRYGLDESEPPFIGARVHAPPNWRRGGQSAQSATREGDQTVKVYQFELIAEKPGETMVTPVLYLGPHLSLGMHGDSLLGAPITLVILPLAEPVLWPWFLGGAIVAVGIGSLLARWLKKRSAASYRRPTVPPLDEALEMLAAIRANRREDRAQQYLGDIERLLHGYLSRRIGTSLTGQTAAEIAAAAGRHVSDGETIAELREILKQCTASKFGGARIDFNVLAGLEDRVRQVLERLDAAWV